MTESALDPTTAREIKSGSGWMIAYGVILVILGFMAIGSPFMIGITTAMLVGGIVLVGGILQCVHAFKCSSFGWGLWTFILGLLTVACGALMLAHPLLGLGFMTLMLIIYFLTEGLFEIVHAFQIKPIQGWGFVLFSGIVSVLLAFLLWRQWPVSGAWAVGMLVGLKILFTGWAAIGVGFGARALTTRAATA